MAVSGGGKRLIAVTIDDGLNRVEQRIGVLLAAVGDLREPNEAVHDELNSTALRAFRAGAPMWEPASKWIGYSDEPKYAGRKRGILFGEWRGGRSGPRKSTVKIVNGDVVNVPLPARSAGRGKRMAILRWTTGAQRSPWTPWERLGPSFAEKSSPWHVWTNRRDGFVWGSSLPYAASHQFGRGTQKWDKKPIPRRPIVGAASEGGKKIAAAYRRWIHDHVEGGIGATRTGLLSRAQVLREFGRGP